MTTTEVIEKYPGYSRRQVAFNYRLKQKENKNV